MSTQQTEQKGRGVVLSTVIETAWVCAHYAHGKTLPAWLQHSLAYIQKQAGAGRLPILILPAAGQPESFVVMTLREFLIWSQRSAHRKLARRIQATVRRSEGGADESRTD